MRIHSDRGGVLFCAVAYLFSAGFIAYLACQVHSEASETLGYGMFGAYSVLAAGIVLAAADLLISDGRILEMRAEGCMVSLGRVQRFYRWDEFVVMRREKYKFSMVRPAVYDECVLFSLREKSRKTCPSLYAMLHPWACFTIHAKQDPKKVKWVRGYLNIYEVDMQILHEKLTEWGVAVEGLTEPSR